MIEAAAHGADAILLIVALLEERALRDFVSWRTIEWRRWSKRTTTSSSKRHWLGAERRGNNRNLHTFCESDTSLHLAAKIPPRGQGQRKRHYSRTDVAGWQPPISRSWWASI
jgi:hypothetical protein